MENIIIDRVIECFVKLKWRLVSAWISNILYSLDSSVFALLKSIKNSGPVEIKRKIKCTLKQKAMTTNVDGLVLCGGSFYNESSSRKIFMSYYRENDQILTSVCWFFFSRDSFSVCFIHFEGQTRMG